MALVLPLFGAAKKDLPLDAGPEIADSNAQASAGQLLLVSNISTTTVDTYKCQKIQPESDLQLDIISYH